MVMHTFQVDFGFLFAAVIVVAGMLKYFASKWVDAQIVKFQHASLIAMFVVLAISTVMAQPSIIDLVMVPLELCALFVLRWICRVEGRGCVNSSGGANRTV
jgi:Ca2+/Na+ antiporter